LYHDKGSPPAVEIRRRRCAPRPDPKAADELMSVHMKRDIKRAPDLLESASLPCAVVMTRA
jgi:hypothetical protein